MPALSQTADSVIQRPDTVEQYYAPQYLDGFPDTQAGDSTLGSINSLPVMELPAKGEAQQFVRSPLHDTPSMALLIAGLLTVALSYHTGYKYIENFFHYMFSTRRRENLFEDHTVNETKILAALIANTCIVEGLLVYLAVQFLRPSLAASLQSLYGAWIYFWRLGEFQIMARWIQGHPSFFRPFIAACIGALNGLSGPWQIAINRCGITVFGSPVNLCL